jgi:hypothetical protein
MHRNGDLVAICASIATQNLCCIIYFFGCNRLTLMHPFLGFPLHFVGNNATPLLCCISIPCVAIESCYSHHTRDVAFEQLCSNVEFWLQIWNNYIATYNLGCSYVFVLLQYMEGYCFVCSLKMQYRVCIATKFSRCIIFHDCCNYTKVIATRYSLVAL